MNVQPAQQGRRDVLADMLTNRASGESARSDKGAMAWPRPSLRRAFDAGEHVSRAQKSNVTMGAEAEEEAVTGGDDVGTGGNGGRDDVSSSGPSGTVRGVASGVTRSMAST
jgi:hypothetical protein